MKVFVVLCSVLASCLAAPGVGYSYSAVAPVHGGVVSPYSVWGVAAPYAYAAPGVVHAASPYVYAAPALALKSQYHAQDYFGHSAYGHVEPGQTHTAVQDGAGNKVGSFSYVKPDGGISRTDYVADALGYRVASNDLPVASLVQPAPVAETAEVAAARVAHMAEVEKAKSRARRDVLLPASTSPLVHHAVPVVHTVPAPVVAPVVHTVPAPVVHTVPAPVVAPLIAGAPVVAPLIAGAPVVPAPLIAGAPVVAPLIAGAPVVPAPLIAGAPVVHPVLVPGGAVPDTPEVHAAKVAHMAEHAKAASRTRRAVLYSTPYSTHYTGYGHLPYTTYAHRTPLAYTASPYYYNHALNAHYVA